MTRAEAVAIVQMHLGFRTSLTDTIVTQLQLQQTKLELMPTKPWFLLTHDAPLVTASNVRRVALPADFLEEYEEGAVYYISADTEVPPKKLVKDAFDVLRKNYEEATPGEPEAYSLDGDSFSIFPLPDAVYNLQFSYYAKAAVLSGTSSTNSWLDVVPELLIGKAGLAVASGLRDFKAIEIFNGMIAENMVILNSQNEARKHANYDMQIGGQH